MSLCKKCAGDIEVLAPEKLKQYAEEQYSEMNEAYGPHIRDIERYIGQIRANIKNWKSLVEKGDAHKDAGELTKKFNNSMRDNVQRILDAAESLHDADKHYRGTQD